MTNNFLCAQIYQILALNDEMLKAAASPATSTTLSAMCRRTS